MDSIKSNLEANKNTIQQKELKEMKEQLEQLKQMKNKTSQSA